MPRKRLTHLKARRAIIDAALRTDTIDLNHGTTGNIGFRVGETFLVTPSGLYYDTMTPADIVEMDLRAAASGARESPPANGASIAISSPRGRM